MTAAALIAASDLSPRSAQVAARAGELALGLNMRLILAHVVSPAVAEALEDDGATETVDAEADSAEAGGPLRAFGKRLLSRRLRAAPQDPTAALLAVAEGLDPAPDIRILGGNPPEELAALARLEAARLLVLGLHAERRVLDVLRLTTMEKIVLAAPVPVLIAHREATRPYRRVLALTDFSPASAAALRIAAELAPGATFHAIHALQLPLGAVLSGQEASTDEHLTRAELMRTAFLSTPGLPDLAEAPEIVPGGVHEVLAFRQDELGADLVCIGTHSGRDPTQLGNYARDLMRAPPTDLLVAKPM